jgi:hypothetical protein
MKGGERKKGGRKRKREGEGDHWIRAVRGVSIRASLHG